MTFGRLVRSGPRRYSGGRTGAVMRLHPPSLRSAGLPAGLALAAALAAGAQFNPVPSVKPAAGSTYSEKFRSACADLKDDPDDGLAMVRLRDSVARSAGDERARGMVILRLAALRDGRAREAETLLRDLKRAFPNSPCVEMAGDEQVSAPCAACGGKGGDEKVCASCKGSGKCSHCKGTGGRRGAHQRPCGSCHGTGRCDACGGRGKDVTKCKTCKGKGALVSGDKIADQIRKLADLGQ